VRTIIVAGEPGGSVGPVRERIRAAWNGARVVDHYGMTEVGPVAVEDAKREGVLRVLEDSYFAEVIELDGTAPVPEGAVGELVLTPLGRTAWPLLRYRTGDLVKHTRDALGLALEGGIVGRADDMIVVRGVNVYPSAIEAAVRRVPEIDEYRVEVSRRGEMAELEIHAECRTAAIAEQLARALEQALALRIPVHRAEPGSLPRFEMKAKRWHVSRIS
jgi:phenylacetate-CoA ligase